MVAAAGQSAAAAVAANRIELARSWRSRCITLGSERVALLRDLTDRDERARQRRMAASRVDSGAMRDGWCRECRDDETGADVRVACGLMDCRAA
ncbi:hypothetical protein Q3A80_02750 [Burkholderia sp. SR8]|jgi:hypothetical protein|uniref:hypothetical protein n=1 Tax=Burkholderia sp. SR8 TaxID=3062277 RepID=UPI00406478E2